MSCLSDKNLAALVDGSADAEQSLRWKEHISTCDACATRLARKQVGLSQPEPTSDSAADPDATITVGTEAAFTQQGLPLVMLCERRDA